MDAAVISALSGLAGAAIGGATSAFTSVLSEVTKNRRKTAEDLFNRRVRVYDDFIREAADHYVDDLTRESDDPKALVSLFSLMAIMRLRSPREVVAAAESVMVNLRKVYESPNRTLSQINMYSKGGDTDPLLEFSEAARVDLESSQASLLR